MENEMNEVTLAKDFPAAEKPKAKPKKKAAPELVPVELLRDYRPVGDFKVWTIEERDEDGDPIKYGKRDPLGTPDTEGVFLNNLGREFPRIIPATGEYEMVRKGRIIDVDKKQANRMLKLKIGQKPQEHYL